MTSSINTNPPVKWRPRKSGYVEGLEYMRGRMNGTIKSLRTPWAKFDDAGVGDGIDWQTTLILAGRSGNLKSTIKDNILQKSFDLNPDQTFRVLDFSFEMLSKVTALREFSSATGKTYKYLCSHDGQFNKEDLRICYEYAKEKANPVKYPVDIIEEPCMVNQFVEIVHEYMEAYKTESGYTKTIISVDHSLLFIKAPYEGNEHEMLANLGKALTMLKRKYPVIFIILSQLNRNIEQTARSENGKHGNYIVASDIYGSDSLLIHADIVVASNRPYLMQIQWFGPSRYIISGEDVVVLHFLKCRNGENRMSFFRANFNKMELEEMETPPCALDRSQRQQKGEPEIKQLKPLPHNDLFTNQKI